MYSTIRVRRAENTRTYEYTEIIIALPRGGRATHMRCRATTAYRHAQHIQTCAFCRNVTNGSSVASFARAKKLGISATGAEA